MAKTAAKKRPPARAMATARSASKKSRSSVTKPVIQRTAKAKLRSASKAIKRPVKRTARPKKVARKATSPRKRVSKTEKKIARPREIVKKPGSKKAVKKVVVAAKAAVKTVAKAIQPKLNGDSKIGFAKHVVAPVRAAKSAAPPKAASKATVAKSEPVLIPDSRVATNQKPRKNQAGLGVKELENFRALLLDKRREILGDMRSMENEALGSNGNALSASPVNVTDMGTDNYEQEFTLGLVEKDRMLLREINNALAKIQNGTYGICEGTGNAIGKPRLEVQPWARYSIEFARLRERNGMGIR